jgi:hypothetical protein
VNIETVVLFLVGQDLGQAADSFEIVEQDLGQVTVLATFSLTAQEQVQAAVEADLQVARPEIVTLDPDTSDSPEDIDFSELPDLPGAA